MIGSLFGTPIAFKIPRLLFINLCELLTCVIWRHFFLTITWLIGETGQHPWFSLNLEDIGGIWSYKCICLSISIWYLEGDGFPSSQTKCFFSGNYPLSQNLPPILTSKKKSLYSKPVCTISTGTTTFPRSQDTRNGPSGTGHISSPAASLRELPPGCNLKVLITVAANQQNQTHKNWGQVSQYHDH